MQPDTAIFATARNPSKLSPLAALGIATLVLDVTSTASIAAAFSAISSTLSDTAGLNMLIDNAAGSYTMPIVDASLDEARALFDVNVWSHMAVTQPFCLYYYDAPPQPATTRTAVPHTP